MKTISTKTKWISTDGWRGYSQFINAVAGANDTGTFSDSPCPSGLRKQEIKEFCKRLKKEGISYRTAWAQTSNVFCVSQQVLVHPEDKERAIEIAIEHQKETRLFYAITD